MKKIFFWILIAIYFSSFTFAATTTTVFDGWTKYIDTIEYKGETYKIRANDVHYPDEDDADRGKVFLSIGADRHLIAYDDCVQSDTYKYCFENRSFEREEVDIDSEGTLQPAIKLLFQEFELGSDLKTTKTFSTTKFIIDGTADVEIEIENEGDFEFTNIHLQEIVPDNFKITKTSSNINNIGNTFDTYFNLYPGSKWSGYYTIKALEEQEVTYESNITYDTVSQSGIEDSFGEKKLEFIDTHSFKNSKLKTSYHRGDKTVFSLDIENKDDYDLTVDEIKITVPFEVSAHATKGLGQETYNVFTNLHNTIEFEESKDYDVDLTFNTVGNFTLEYYVKLVGRDDEVFIYEGEQNFTVKISGVECYVDIPDEIDAATSTQYSIVVKNHDDEPFYDIEGKYYVYDAIQKFSLVNINPDSADTVGTGRVLFPFSLDEITHNFSVVGTYRTENNQYFNCDTSKVVTVVPAEKMVEVSILFDKREAQRNTKTPATITVRNLLDVDLDEDIILEFSGDGVAQAIEFSGLSDEREFETEVELGEWIREEKANVSVIVKIPSLNDYKDSASDTIKIINPYDGDIVIEDIEEETIIEDIKEKDSGKEDLNFFQKIISYFRDFFK